MTALWIEYDYHNQISKIIITHKVQANLCFQPPLKCYVPLQEAGPCFAKHQPPLQAPKYCRNMPEL